MAKHPSARMYSMVNRNVVITLISEKHQITSLAFVATVKNLSSILFQSIAGYILDATSYSALFLICFGCMAGGMVLLGFFRIDSGNDRKLFG